VNKLVVSNVHIILWCRRILLISRRSCSCVVIVSYNAKICKAYWAYNDSVAGRHSGTYLRTHRRLHPVISQRHLALPRPFDTPKLNAPSRSLSVILA
jgi:hypothetical protein